MSSHVALLVIALEMKRVAPVVFRIAVFGILKAPALGPSEVTIRAPCDGFDQ